MRNSLVAVRSAGLPVVARRPAGFSGALPYDVILVTGRCFHFYRDWVQAFLCLIVAISDILACDIKNGKTHSCTTVLPFGLYVGLPQLLK